MREASWWTFYKLMGVYRFEVVYGTETMVGARFDGYLGGE